MTAVMRSYQGYYTRSHQNSEVKRLWAGIVLGWVTSREVPVLHPFSKKIKKYFAAAHMLCRGEKKLEKTTGKDPRNQIKGKKRIQSGDPMYSFKKGEKKNSPEKAYKTTLT